MRSYEVMVEEEIEIMTTSELIITPEGLVVKETGEVVGRVYYY